MKNKIARNIIEQIIQTRADIVTQIATHELDDDYISIIKLHMLDALNEIQEAFTNSKCIDCGTTTKHTRRCLFMNYELDTTLSQLSRQIRNSLH